MVVPFDSQTVKEVNFFCVLQAYKMGRFNRDITTDKLLLASLPVNVVDGVRFELFSAVQVGKYKNLRDVINSQARAQSLLTHHF